MGPSHADPAQMVFGLPRGHGPMGPSHADPAQMVFGLPRGHGPMGPSHADPLQVKCHSSLLEWQPIVSRPSLRFTHVFFGAEKSGQPIAARRSGAVGSNKI